MPSFAERLQALQTQGPSSFADRLAALESKPSVAEIAKGRVEKLKAETEANKDQGFLSSLAEQVVPSLDSIKTVAGAIGALGPGQMFDSMGNIISGVAGAQLDQFRQAGDAFKKGEIVEGLEHGYAGVVPVMGPILQGAREEFKSGNILGALGTATGAIANLVAPEAAVKAAGGAAKFAPKLRANAEGQYASVFSRSGRQASTVDRTVPEMIDRGVTFSTPDELADIVADGGHAAAQQKNAALANLPPGSSVPAQDIVQRIQQAKQRHMTQAGPMGPDAERAIAELDELEQTVLANAKGGMIDALEAEKLRRYFDSLTGDTHANPASTPATKPEVYKATADAIRPEMNALPGISEANKNVSFYKNVERLQETMPKSTRTPGQVIGQNAALAGGGVLARAVGVPFGGEVMMAAALWRTIRDVPKTPAWKTASAVKKAQFAKALQSGDMATAAQIAAEIGAGTAITDEAINQ